MDYTINKVKIFIYIVLLVLFVWLVLYGQTEIGYWGFGKQLLGYVGILGLLFTYNHPYR